MPNKKIDINDIDSWSNIDWNDKPNSDALKRTDHQVAVARYNRLNKKGKKLEFTPEGKLAHAENSRRTSKIRQYKETIYLGICKKTGKQIKLNIHGLRQHGFNPANVSRVANGYKKSHKGYFWSIFEVKQTKSKDKTNDK